MSRILVIDDELSVCQVIKAVLTASGYAVTIASDGRAGIDAVEQQDYSAAIVDLCMPNLNGIETIREFKTLAPDMALIVMSGLIAGCGNESTPDFLGMALNLGGIPKLTKPFKRQELLDVVAKTVPKEAPLGEKDPAPDAA